jgi:hypothetical protein
MSMNTVGEYRRRKRRVEMEMVIATEVRMRV